MKPVLDYNEQKIFSGGADLLFVRNLPDESFATIHETFHRMETNNAIDARTKNISFHMSVNPGQGDKTKESQIPDLIDEMMQGLGYGDQPYVVYRHKDIDRTHYHVVSIRVNEEGKAINAKNERRNCNKLMWKTAEKYGFTPGLGDGKSEKINFEGFRFNVKAGSAMQQYSTLFDAAIQYDFRSFAQFQCIMQAFGVKVTETESVSGKRLAFQGLSSKGRPCTHPIYEKDMGEAFHEKLQRNMQGYIDYNADRRKERARVMGYVGACLDHATSRDHFVNMLKANGIDTFFSVTEEGKPFGVTFVDHTTKTVLKGSELGKGFSISMITDRENNGVWEKPDPKSINGISLSSLRSGQQDSSADQETGRKESMEETVSNGMATFGILSALISSAGSGGGPDHREKRDEEEERKRRRRRKKNQ